MPSTHLIGGTVGPRTHLDILEKKNHSPLMGIEPQFEQLMAQLLYQLP